MENIIDDVPTNNGKIIKPCRNLIYQILFFYYYDKNSALLFSKLILMLFADILKVGIAELKLIRVIKNHKLKMNF
jgi:hypothetical protein